MTDLSDFLLARIAGDEAVARQGGQWDGGTEIAWRDVGGISESLIIGTDRVLAECDAKRRIVDEARRGDAALAAGLVNSSNVSLAASGQLVLRLLALPYADHPNYREEWRP